MERGLDMHLRLCVVIGLVSALLMSACELDEEGASDAVGGDVGPNTAQGTCVQNDGSVCLEFAGAGWDEQSAGDTCVDADQTFIWGGLCATANVVGTCRIAADGEDLAVRDYYYTPFFDAASGETQCEGSGGTFTAR